MPTVGWQVVALLRQLESLRSEKREARGERRQELSDEITEAECELAEIIDDLRVR